MLLFLTGPPVEDFVIYLKYMLSGNPCASIRCDGPLRIGPPRPCECPEPEKKKKKKKEEKRRKKKNIEKKIVCWGNMRTKIK